MKVFVIIAFAALVVSVVIFATGVSGAFEAAFGRRPASEAVRNQRAGSVKTSGSGMVSPTTTPLK